MELATIANVITVGTIVAAGSSLLWSWLRKGVVHNFYQTIEKIDHIEQHVDDIKSWTKDAEVVFIELAKDDTKVSPQGVKDLFGVEDTRTVILRNENTDPDQENDESTEPTE